MWSYRIFGGSGKNIWSKHKDYIEGEKTPDNTKLLLHFDNSIEDTTSLNTPTVYGVEKYDAGKFKNAFKFDGTNCVTLAYNSNLIFGKNNFTIAGWFYTETVKQQGFFSDRHKYSDSFSTAGTTVSMNSDGKFYVEMYSSSQPTSSTQLAKKALDTSVPLGEWFHLALVRNSSTITLYLNGISIFSVSISSAVLYQYKSLSNFKIGSTTVTSSGTNPTDFFVGLIDEFIIVNGTALWTSNFTPPSLMYGGDSGEFEGYVVSDDENKYPNGGYSEDGYYYKNRTNELL